MAAQQHTAVEATADMEGVSVDLAMMSLDDHDSILSSRLGPAGCGGHAMLATDVDVMTPFRVISASSGHPRDAHFDQQGFPQSLIVSVDGLSQIVSGQDARTSVSEYPQSSGTDRSR